MDKLLKVAVIVGFLLTGFGVFYHYVIFLPDLERQRVAREELETSSAAERAESERIEAAKRAALERQAALLAEEQQMEPARRAEIAKHEAALRNINRKSYYECLNSVRKRYEDDWANACKTQAKLHSVQIRNCLETRGLGETFCDATYGAADPSPQCTLRRSMADEINRHHDKEKQQCLAEAKLL